MTRSVAYICYGEKQGYVTLLMLISTNVLIVKAASGLSIHIVLPGQKTYTFQNRHMEISYILENASRTIPPLAMDSRTEQP